ncbi:MAG TPA: hypothetical protein VFU15_15660 [Bacteroidia bacterium]|nr:hypothetical protein [Bacteroidia bacterium]
MKRFSLFLIFLVPFLQIRAQHVSGKIKSTGNADLHVIRLYADSFPKVDLVFQAEDTLGNPVWNLAQKDVRVEEDGRQGRITSFQLLSEEQHLQTMLVIDHSALDDGEYLVRLESTAAVSGTKKLIVRH